MSYVGQTRAQSLENQIAGHRELIAANEAAIAEYRTMAQAAETTAIAKRWQDKARACKAAIEMELYLVRQKEAELGRISPEQAGSKRAYDAREPSATPSPEREPRKRKPVQRVEQAPPVKMSHKQMVKELKDAGYICYKRKTKRSKR